MRVKGGGSQFRWIATQISDGYISSAILVNYINKVFPNLPIHYMLHDGKQHGVIIEKVPKDTNLLIIPDAGSNQLLEHKTLKEQGIDVIVLDHHEVDVESEYAIVVNNHLSPDYKNRDISGAGIVYKFCQALDDELNVSYADKFLDLVAVGCIGDMMDMTSPETRYYAFKGLSRINNPFLEKLYKYIAKNEKTITTTAFYVVPLINAVIRIGTQEEKERLFKALLENEDENYSNIIEEIKTIKVRQDKLRDKGFELIKCKIESENLLKNKALIIDVTNVLDKNLTGLVANQVSRLYKRPVLLIRKKADDSNILAGSARGYDKGFIKDFKQFLRDSGLVKLAEGHANSFGVEIEEDKIKKLNIYINNKLIDVLIEDVYEVDFEFNHLTINKNVIAELHDYRYLWGGGVDEPLLAYSKIPVSKSELKLVGKTAKKVLKFYVKGVEFIKFNFDVKQFDELFHQDGTYIFNIVGRAYVNEWRGVYTPQIIVEDFEIIDIKNEILF